MAYPTGRGVRTAAVLMEGTLGAETLKEIYQNLAALEGKLHSHFLVPIIKQLVGEGVAQCMQTSLPPCL